MGLRGYKDNEPWHPCPNRQADMGEHMPSVILPPAASGGLISTFTLGLGEMIRVYETCVRIREISKQQLALSDDMALIAINAEIAAAKSLVNQEVFMILANETGKIARQMSGHVAQVLEDADVLARDALLGVVKTRRLAKYNKGLAGTRRPENARRLEKVAQDLDASLAALMDGIAKSQQEIEGTRKALAKQNQRVSRIITYFRIEASRDADHGSYFRNIAEDLNSLIAQAQLISKELQEVLKERSY
ncbi:hypothetical protein D3C87_968520 [compost metagenome]